MTLPHLVLTTVASETDAERLVRQLLEARLVACGNILPSGSSLYWWKGEVQQEEEVLILLKTTAARLEALLEAAPALHPYEVPEILVLPVVGGHGPYLSWLLEAVGGGGTKKDDLGVT